MKHLLAMVGLIIGAQASAMQKEIEIKVKLSDVNVARVQQWIAKSAEYKGDIAQSDYYLTNPDKPDWIATHGFKDVRSTIRVRATNKDNFLCYKYRHVDPVTNQITSVDEYETVVENPHVVLNIFEQLGYTHKTVVSKKRHVYMIGDRYELVLDMVKDLGLFVEIELKQPVDDPQAGRQELFDLLAKMGVDTCVSYTRGYIHMLWNPNYNFGQEIKI